MSKQLEFDFSEKKSLFDFNFKLPLGLSLGSYGQVDYDGYIHHQIPDHHVYGIDVAHGNDLVNISRLMGYDHNYDSNQMAMANPHCFSEAWLEDLQQKISYRFVGRPNNDMTRNEIYFYIRERIPAGIKFIFSLDSNYDRELSIKIEIVDEDEKYG